MRKVLNNQLPLASRRRHTKLFFFVGSQNRFHLLIYTPWSRVLHGNDIVINTYEIHQIHISFYWLVHINLVVISTWQLHPIHICMLQVGRWCCYTNFACYSCCIEMTPIVYVWILFLLVSAEQIWVAMRVHISLLVVLDNLPSSHRRASLISTFSDS